MHVTRPFRAAEFFAGIGLVRLALEQAGIRVSWANDIEPGKFAMYQGHFGARRSGHYRLGDVRQVAGSDVPDVGVATASFPCTDLSLAGNRAGLAGEQSGMFWEFARVLEEMGSRLPKVVLLENVPGFATSHGGRDLHAAIRRLNELGYVTDVFTMDARLFVPQSRVRMFIVGTQDRIAGLDGLQQTELRPPWISSFFANHGDLAMQAVSMPTPTPHPSSLSDVVERLPRNSDLWWRGDRLAAFLSTIPMSHQTRIADLQAKGKIAWRTAYRRTRGGVCVWEVRPDDLAGCLRTARGGSSKQALVEVTPKEVRARWMTPREYAALQGAGEFVIGNDVTDSKALFGFGDAVCVPVIRWIAEHYLIPAMKHLEQAHQTYELAAV